MSKEQINLEKNQTEPLEMNSVIIEMETSMQGFNGGGGL